MTINRPWLITGNIIYVFVRGMFAKSERTKDVIQEVVDVIKDKLKEFVLAFDNRTEGVLIEVFAQDFNPDSKHSAFSTCTIEEVK